jgi:AcrR family transcriptional regulator
MAVEEKGPDERRPYRMGRRREQMEATRQRIAEAAYELHATVGPINTTVSSVAERAGVQRHTVYHHFPDLTSLFRACTEHALRTTGVPDIAAWMTVQDPADRLRRGLAELYAYYRANARLIGNVVRDLPLMPELRATDAMSPVLRQMVEVLAAGWPGDEETQRLRAAALGLAVSFEAWRSLTDHGLDDEAAVELMAKLVAGSTLG